MELKNNWLGAASLTVLMAAIAAPPVAAQTGGRDIITVTATKREENIQDIPIAVSAYGAELLQRSGVTDIRELQSLSSSLTLAATQSEAAGVNARIRGIGTVGDNAGLESSVGVFIDGVYRSRNSLALGDLGEIERIEVLRGPQGTLFGRNVSAGALNIITKGPSYDPEGNVELSYGNYNNFRASGAVNAPLANDKAAVRLYGVYEQRDGTITDAVTGADYNDRDRFLLRGQLLFEPVDNVSAKFIVDYGERNENCCAAVSQITGPTSAIVNGFTPFTAFQPLGVELAADRGAREATANRGFRQDVQEWGLSAEVNWDVNDFATVTSITAYRDWEVTRGQDIDYTSMDFLFRPDGAFVNSFETFTQELRIAGSTDNFDWLAGFFFADESLSLRDSIAAGTDFEVFTSALVNAALVGAGSPPIFPGFSPLAGLAAGSGFLGVASNDSSQQDSQSWALFTHNTWRLTDALAITGGLRYTEEDKELDATFLSNNGVCNPTFIANVPATFISNPPFPSPAESALIQQVAGIGCLPFFNPLINGDYDGERKESELSGTAKVTYQLNDDILAYASYARGYKAGGFNLDQAGLDNPLLGILTGTIVTADVEDLEIENETVNAYEVGFKTQWLDDLITANVALYIQEFDNFQLNTFNGVSFVAENLSEVTSKGFEVELGSEPIDGLQLQGGLTYNYARIGDDVVSTVFSSNGRPLAGRRLPLSPLWVVTGSATYEREIPALNKVGFVHVDFRHDSGANTGSDLDPQKEQDDYIVFNGSMGLFSLESGWEAEIWAKNMFDRDYAQVIIDSPLQAGSWDVFLAEPRTFGGTVRWRF